MLATKRKNGAPTSSPSRLTESPETPDERSPTAERPAGVQRTPAVKRERRASAATRPPPARVAAPEASETGEQETAPITTPSSRTFRKTPFVRPDRGLLTPAKLPRSMLPDAGNPPADEEAGEAYEIQSDE